jgi:small-conductance mechanosensitive channel
MNILHVFFADSPLSHVLSALILLILAYIGAQLLKLLFSWLLRRFAWKTATSLDDLILKMVAGKIPPLLTMFVLYFIILDFAGSPLAADSRWQLGLGIARECMYIVLAVYIGYVIMRFIDTLVLWYLKDIADRTTTQLDEELAPLVNRVLNIIIYLVVLVVILDHFNQNISTLIVSLGVGSLAIALAAQETIANMIAGFILMMDRPFRHHDRIRLPDGTVGNVYHIGMRSTKVIDDNNVMIITPNAEIVKSQIRNYSYPNDVVRFNIPFSVAYGTDLSEMQRVVIGRINEENDIVDPDTTEARIMELGEFSIKCDALVRIKNPGRIPKRKGEIMLIIHDCLRKAGIEIPYPHHVILTQTSGPAAGDKA